MGMHKKKMMGRGGSAMYRMQKVYGGGMPPKGKKRNPKNGCGMVLNSAPMAKPN